MAVVTGELLTLEETAALLGIKPRTVKAWIAEGKLDGLRLGHKTIRVPRTALEAMLQQKNSGAVTLRGSAGERLREQADRAGMTPEALADFLLTDLEESASGVRNGLEAAAAGRETDFESFVRERSAERGTA